MVGRAAGASAAGIVATAEAAARPLELLPVLSFARLTPQLRRQSDHTLGREE